ncbi:MAG: LacI family DNA-binding transcriptional regulator [Bacteroidetes bacterium]|nr:LacI family DNA-binding transcriptional regulator [Bacteroidota bacterium]
MKITTTEIAKLAGVSQSAVSKVLNGSSIRISEEKRSRIEQAAIKLNYIPNRIAKTLKTGKHNTIAIVTYDLTDAFAGECISAIESFLDSTDYKAFWVSCNHAHNAKRDAFKFLQQVSQSADGIVIILASDFIKDSDIIFLKKTTHIPIITVIRKVSNNAVPSVTSNNKTGTYLLMDHLKKLGHTKVGFFYCDEENTSARDRFNTFREALNDYKFTYTPSFYRLIDGTTLGGYNAGKKLFSLDSIPTAIITYNDLAAIGVLKAAYDMKIDIPSKVSIASFDNIYLSNYSTPSLTTIAVGFEKVCSTALKRIISDIESTYEENTITHYSIEPQLVIRQSTAVAEKTN